MHRLRVAAAQINATVGDLAGNVERILAGIDAAEAAGADLVAFPELAITGYPPEDLLLRPAFVAEAQQALEKIATRTGQTVAVVGFPLAGRDLYNAAAVCAGGSVRGVYRKWLLPKLGNDRDAVIALAQSKLSNYAGDLATLGKNRPQVNWWPAFVREVLQQEATPIEEYEAVPSA